MTELDRIQHSVIACRLCPRLVRWREKVARVKVKRYEMEEYWGKPVPGFGDPRARMLIVGLAPAAHGGNRTGRMFTGDRSGDWLFRALFKAGFASRPESLNRSDGLLLKDCYITATLRCAPPLNKPLPVEVRRCRPYLLAEISFLRRVRVVVGLGKIGFDAALTAFRERELIDFASRPAFHHGAACAFGDRLFLGSFHPSQQNTFTGKLTEPMFDRIFERAREAIRAPVNAPTGSGTSFRHRARSA